MRARTLVWVVLLPCAAGCYADRVVGTSGSSRGAEAEAASNKPRVAARIFPRPDESIGADNPNLGDLDADGFDDFILRGTPYNPEANPKQLAESRYYLFYGRREFPEQLSTADADAVLRADRGYFIETLGDINGDGFDDFALMHEGAVEFMFGSRERLHGELAAETAGVTWRHPGVPEDTGIPAELMVSSAGDWNGDGLDDLLVRAAMSEPLVDPDFGFVASESNQLVLGARGAWRSAEWQPSWSVAEFGFETVETGSEDNPTLIDAMLPLGGGDIDGDGRDDLFGYSYANPLGGLRVFYGGRTLEHDVLPSQADALLELPPGSEPSGFDDVDGDGALDFLVRMVEGTQISIVYGERWSGTMQATTQLTIHLDPLALYSTVMTGDIDGDRAPEIVVASGRSFTDDGALELALYVVRGGERLTGDLELDERYLLARDAFPRPSSKFAGIGGLGIVMAGDVDGDGGRDMLSSVVRTADDPGGVTLIPSGPRPPD